MRAGLQPALTVAMADRPGVVSALARFMTVRMPCDGTDAVGSARKLVAYSCCPLADVCRPTGWPPSLTNPLKPDERNPLALALARLKTARCVEFCMVTNANLLSGEARTP